MITAPHKFSIHAHCMPRLYAWAKSECNLHLYWWAYSNNFGRKNCVFCTYPLHSRIPLKKQCWIWKNARGWNLQFSDFFPIHFPPISSSYLSLLLHSRGSIFSNWTAIYYYLNVIYGFSISHEFIVVCPRMERNKGKPCKLTAFS